MKSQKGFSLIDVLISLALLSIAAVGLGAQFVAQKKSLHALAGKGQSALVMKVVLNWISSNPGMFPRLPLSSGGETLVYVGCFDRRGFPVTSDSNEVKPEFFITPKQATRPYILKANDNQSWGKSCADFFEVEIETGLTEDVASFFPLLKYKVTVSGVDESIEVTQPTIGEDGQPTKAKVADKDRDRITTLTRDNIIPAL